MFAFWKNDEHVFLTCLVHVSNDQRASEIVILLKLLTHIIEPTRAGANRWIQWKGLEKAAWAEWISRKEPERHPGLIGRIWKGPERRRAHRKSHFLTEHDQKDKINLKLLFLLKAKSSSACGFWIEPPPNVKSRRTRRWQSRTGKVWKSVLDALGRSRKPQKKV